MLWVALGGAIGSAARYGINGLVTRQFDGLFPWGILTVNIAGCFIMGLVTALLLKVGGMADTAKLFFVTGVLGGFTTFSAFALDTMKLMQSGHLTLAAGYVLASVALSLLAVFAGFALMRVVVA